MAYRSTGSRASTADVSSLIEMGVDTSCKPRLSSHKGVARRLDDPR
jgi:hypothetical protein